MTVCLGRSPGKEGISDWPQAPALTSARVILGSPLLCMGHMKCLKT